MKKIILLLLISSLFYPLHAQKTKRFSDNPSEFFSEFSDFIKAAKNKDLDQTFEEFTILWQGGSFGGEAEESMIMVCNSMLKAHFIPSPDFNSYLKATNSFYKNEISEFNFSEFNYTLDTLIKMKVSKAEAKSFMGFFEELNNEKVLSGKRGKQWAVDDFNYELKMKKTPYVEFSSVNLMLWGPKDTLQINNTSGRFYILKQKWWGNEGEVTWERAGLSANTVNAQLQHYRIDMNNSGYKADSVEFVNYDAFGDPILGKLEDNLDGRGVNGSNPQFKSYKRKFTLDDLDEYLIYRGGFGMEGRTIMGTGAGYSPAKLTVLREGKKFMNIYSNGFYIKPENIVASNCAVTIYIENDSISHPSLSLNLDREAAYVKLGTSPNEMVATPFYNTYHQLEIYADQFDCYLDSSYFDIRSRRDPEGRASFESLNYFSRKRFEKLRGTMSYNPLFKMNDLYALYQRRTYTEEELKSFFGVETIGAIQPLLVLMSSQGYLIYNIENKEITLQDKLFTYINAYLHKIDYDVLQLNSMIKDKPNSRFYFANNNLEVRGINTIRLSDSQNVQIYPAKQTIIFKKNRDMQFDGYLKAGRFEYFGKGFEFSYEDFQINMLQIDSMMFNFPDEKAGGILRRVNTVIQDITGKLQIDKPDNKSGRRSTPNFPIFDCFKGAYVYYDYKTVFNGVYDRERFYFKLKPFVVDSLDNFSMKGMNLDGTFVSASILPEFEYKLDLQPDFSLGFSTETPPEGYPLYKGTGHCNMKIYLSNRGLRGNGKFTYNGAEITSEDMLFFPDSMLAMQTVFAMDDTERKKFPNVNSQNCELSWTPYRDTMIIAAVDTSAFINMYEPESFLKGELVFTKKEMYGKGLFNYRQGILSSDYYNFKHRTLSADSTKFELYDESMEKIALQNESVKVGIDFDKQELKGATNSDEIETKLTLNQYTTNIPFFTWKVPDKKVYLEKGKENEDIDFFFVSTNPVFDSLTFAPSSAELDLSTFNIQAFDIKYFLVGDAKVKPEATVEISENGSIPALENAEIVASFENEYHTVKRASVNIFSSKRLTATGWYQYTDPNDKLWEIPMDEIRTTEEGITRGVGTIPDTMNFHFGSNIGYNGNLIFESNRKEIAFSGEVNIEHPQIDALATEKFKFDGLVAFDSLYFNVTNAKNILGQELHTGIFLNTKTRQLYPLFLGVKQTPNDLALYRAEGDLYLDPDSNMFVITAFSRYYEGNPSPSIWVYDIDTGAMYMNGPLNFGYKIENFDFDLSGHLTHNLKTSETKINMFGGINFPLEDAATKVMSDSIINFGFFNPDVNNIKEYIIAGVTRQLSDPKEVDKAIDNIYKTGNIPTYKEYEPLFNFGETVLVWDTTSKSFRNYGQIGMANIKNYPVNKKLNGRIDFFKTTFTDSVTIYLEGNSGNWYLFTFVEEELYIESSDAEFLQRALDKKPKEVVGKLSYRKAEEEMIVKTREKAIRIEE
ncbi:hypothetical protein GC194_11960 [bacterium]|nr:hypothetical protein [bacterium]